MSFHSEKWAFDSASAHFLCLHNSSSFYAILSSFVQTHREGQLFTRKKQNIAFENVVRFERMEGWGYQSYKVRDYQKWVDMGGGKKHGGLESFGIIRTKNRGQSREFCGLALLRFWYIREQMPTHYGNAICTRTKRIEFAEKSEEKIQKLGLFWRAHNGFLRKSVTA